MTMDLRLGDCLEILSALGQQVDSVVTDPPYGLGFMGARWDGVVPPSVFWRVVQARLRPGGYMLAFGGTRTYHRLVCAIEDAGFEIRDCLMWLYGSGFPKGKACLKPGWEPIVLARRPGRSIPLNIDDCRIEALESTLRRTSGARNGNAMNCANDGSLSTARVNGSDEGRWPANVMLDEEAGAMLDAQAGERSSGAFPAKRRGIGYCEGGGGTNSGTLGDRRESNSGGASRFFYCPKASSSDRESGNSHPTVKPTELMRWLCRLITPEGGVILDPFMGSGSTLKAAALEGFSGIGIEIDPAWYAIAQARVKAAREATPLFREDFHDIPG